MNILFVGDIVGNPGRKTLKEVLNSIKKDFKIDFCIANGENSAGGVGITYSITQELYKMGIHAITLGNHTWAKKEILNFIDTDEKIIRPANYPEEVPGKGSMIIDNGKEKIGIINLLGRVYMDSLDCPFKCAKREIEYLKKFVKVIVIDFHAEATSEKAALAWYLDGQVSAVLGTHTHVQTADERILPCGTAFITDVGMTGPYEGIIGVNRNIIIEKFNTGIPVKFEIAHGKTQFNAVFMEIDEICGKTKKIERINKIFD